MHGGTATTSITVTDPRPLAIAIRDISPADCHGSATGTVYLKATGGTYPYTFTPEAGTIQTSIENGDTLVTVSRLTAGSYTFTLTDSHGCTIKSSTATVAQPEQLLITTSSPVHPRCGVENGSIAVSAAGGIGPYVYHLVKVNQTDPLQIKTSGSSISFENIASGSYRIVVTDHNDCSTQSEILVFDEYINPSVKSVSVEPVKCFGENNGSITVSAQEGTAALSHYSLAHTDTEDTPRLETSGIFDQLTAGTYTLFVFDSNGCRSTNAYPTVVGQPASLSITAGSIVPVVNKGADDGKLPFRITGGNTGNVQVLLFNEESSITDSLLAVKDFERSFAARAGSYTLQATDPKGCTYKTGTIQVNEPSDSLKIVVQEVKNALCKSQSGRIVVTAEGGWGGYRYKRATDENYSSLNRFENLYPGTYTITVTDRMGATTSKSITVHEPQDSLKAMVTTIRPPSCNSDGVISIALSGGTAPYKLFATQSSDTVFAETAGTVQWNNAPAGSLPLRLTDANGCRFELETVVPSTSLLKITEIRTTAPDRYANNGRITATVKGGTDPLTCIWQRVGSEDTFPNTTSISNLTDGYYRLTVTDAGGCSASQTIGLPTTGDTPLEIVKTGDERSLNAGNGYAVLRSNMAPANIRIIRPDNSYTDYSSTTETPDLHVAGDTIYLNSLTGGKWAVIATDTKGQRSMAEFDILPYRKFVFSTSNIAPVLTPGGANGAVIATVAGGAGNNTFTWTNGNGSVISSSDDDYTSAIRNLQAGKYTVTATDRYGNIISAVANVPEPSTALTLQVERKQNQSCNGFIDAYVILSANGGWGDYRFAEIIAGQSTFQNSSLFEDLDTDEHRFRVVDKYGTAAEITIPVTEPDLLHARIAKVKNVTCKGNINGQITFDITGGTAPYYFREQGATVWKRGNVADNLAEGKYIFEFTDSLQCACPDIVHTIVTAPDSLLFRNVQTKHTTCGQDNGQIEVSLTGGTRPYVYKWTDPEGNVIPTDSVAATLKRDALYRLDVTDANGCTQHLEQMIQGSRPPRVLNVKTTDNRCYGDKSGTAEIVNVEAGQPYAPYAFTWSNGTDGTSTENLPAGQHAVTITDTNHCASTYHFDITQPDSLYISILDYRKPYCFGYSDGYIHAGAYGGAGEKSYLWSNGETTSGINNIAKGDYQVQATDRNGCVSKKRFLLDEPAYQTVDLGANITMCPGNTHVADAGNYVSYRWFTDNGGNLSTERYLNITKAGNYRLEARTPDGCPAWGSVSVEIGNSALQAVMLAASVSAINDTLRIFELSNLPVDTIAWSYDTEAFSRIYTKDTYDQQYILQLKCKKAGVYTIGMQAWSGGCYSPASGLVEIFEETGSRKSEQWGISPLIKDLKVYPNPSDGNFVVEIILRETMDASLKFFEAVSGLVADKRAVTGLDLYRLQYTLSGLRPGIYILMVTVGTEQRQIKIMIN